MILWWQEGITAIERKLEFKPMVAQGAEAPVEAMMFQGDSARIL